jgi:hypothetical protein
MADAVAVLFPIDALSQNLTSPDQAATSRPRLSRMSGIEATSTID